MRNRLVRFLVKAALVVVMLATILVWQKITVVKMVRANDVLLQKVELKEETARKVSTEISRLRQRSRIEKIAIEHLGLVPTHPKQRRLIPGGFRSDMDEGQNRMARLNNALKKFLVVQSDNEPPGGESR